MIRAFLADDEEHALNILKLLLLRTGEVEVVGTASNGFDAIERLRALRPDVAFLDIEMPGMNGVELAELILSEHLDIQIVFVTAYDQYAISAFEQEAVDYLLKPLEKDRLAKTVQRLKREAAKQRPSPAPVDNPVLRVRLMGDIAAEGAGQERIKWRTGKEKELFAFLALRGKERIHRDVLLNALWPEENYRKAKGYLHTCVSFLRKDLRRLGFEGILKYEDEKYYLEPGAIETDYERWLDAIRAIKQDPAGDRVEEMERVLSLYQGTLFKDEDYPWAEDEVRHLEQAAGELRTELAKQYERRREYGKMIEAAQRQLAHSPYDEEACRLLMRGYYAEGKHDEVFRVYRQMLARLEELEIEPSEKTKRLFADIRMAKPGALSE